MQGLFQNYVSNPKDGSEGRAGLGTDVLIWREHTLIMTGLGHAGATGLGTFFQFFCYITPILGAIIADQYLGRYNTLLIFCYVYILGLCILTITALPGTMYRSDAGLIGFIISLICQYDSSLCSRIRQLLTILVIGFGTGGIKSNTAPLIADQYTRYKMAIKIDEKGDRVILDPVVTIQRIYMIFYA
jgi:proton-dependent oligopeptide transporter, POT family